MSLSPEAFSWVADLVRREAAIVLETGKEYLVESRLLQLARTAGTDVDGYIGQVRARGTALDREAIVEALTTNETSWFRDREPFEVFVKNVLPEVLDAPNPMKKINIWSSACSSGQEAYTLAMLLTEHLPAGWSAEILATDISKQMLQRVDEGRYSQLEIGRGLPAPQMVKYFTRAGTQWEVSPQLKSMVRTQYLNLAAPFPLLPQFDIVFLRNVLIYFDPQTKSDILRRTRKVTKPGGFLFLGAAESTLGIDDEWERERLERYTLIRNPKTAQLATNPRMALAGNGI